MYLLDLTKLPTALTVSVHAHSAYIYIYVCVCTYAHTPHTDLDVIPVTFKKKVLIKNMFCKM